MMWIGCPALACRLWSVEIGLVVWLEKVSVMVGDMCVRLLLRRVVEAPLARAVCSRISRWRAIVISVSARLLEQEPTIRFAINFAIFGA